MWDVPCAVRMRSKVRMLSSETCVKTFENVAECIAKVYDR